MPVFQDEHIANTPLERDNIPQVALGTPELTPFSGAPALSSDEEGVASQRSRDGLSGEQLTKLASRPGPGGGVNLIPLSEIEANKRYPTYVRNMDLETVYGLQQPWYKQLGNSIIKGAATMTGTFLQSFATIPDTIAAIKTGASEKSFSKGMAELSNPKGYEADIDKFLKNLEDVFPNYMTRWERDHPFLSAISPKGAANWWGENIIKNSGFMVGSMLGAAAQDTAIGLVTGGVGDVPLIGNQLSRMFLKIGKLAATSTTLERDLTYAGKGIGETIEALSATQRIKTGLRYGLANYSAARSEAAVESRDGYNQVKEALISQYKESHEGEPTGADLAEIEDYATNAMNVRFGINMALLTASNAIQFDNIFKSMTSAKKGAVGSVARELEDTGKIGLVDKSLDTFEKKAAKGFGEKLWNTIKPAIPNILSEGVYEEGGQYAAERGTLDYYTRQYKAKKHQQSWDDAHEITASTLKGLADQFQTTEGLQNMLVGGLTAVITGAVMHKYDDYKGRGKDKRLDTAINILNQYGLTGVLSKQYENTAESLAIAKEMKAAADSGDIFKYKNLQKDAFFKMVHSRLSNDLHDFTIDQLNMLKELDKDEFVKYFGVDFDSTNKKTVNEYVDALIEKANDIKKNYESIDRAFKNPFKVVKDPKTDDDVLNIFNHNTFESWKENLTKYAYESTDLNSRLNDIQQSVANINPAISNDLLSKLTNRSSLKELADTYEEKANLLNKTISPELSIEDRKAAKEQVKALRTKAEKIKIALNTKFDDKIFNELLNFELNNQDATKDVVVGQNWASDLYSYGHDLNRINETKKKAVKLYNDLASESGVSKYFSEAQKIRDGEVEGMVNPFPEEEKEEPATPETEDAATKVIHEFTNKAGLKENILEGREYEIPKSKLASVDKIADDRWQVTAPDGTITFYPTEEKAKAAAEELNEDFGNLRKVKVIALNPDGTVKVEDINGDIYDVSPKTFEGYEKLETQQEKLQKFKENIDKEQRDIQTKSGDVGTGESSDYMDKQPYEDPKKSLQRQYTTTTSESEGKSDEPTDINLLKPHHVRSITFLNNAKFFPNRNKLRAMFVTANQEKDFGLVGDDGSTLSSISLAGTTINSTDIDKGFIAVVYVEQDGDTLYFVDSKGERISKVDGSPTDLSRVVFNTMPDTSTTWTNGKPRYRVGDVDKIINESQRWRAKREQLFAMPSSKPEISRFNISNGIPVIINSNARNAVVKALLSGKEEDLLQLISTHQGLVTISTDGLLTFGGETLKVPVGVPIFNYKDTWQFLNNRNFTKNEAQTIFEILKSISNGINSDLAVNKPIKLNRIYTSFLQNVLFWKEGVKDTTKNQISIDTETMDLLFNGQRYDLTKIADFEQDIVERLQTVYNNINNASLTKDFNETFDEVYLEDDQLKSREWKNYQTYLLSHRNPDGSTRTNLPLATNVAEKSESVPFSFKQKYAILEELEFPVLETKPEVIKQEEKPVLALPTPEAPTATAPVTKIGEYNVDGSTQKFKLKAGEVEFKATLDEKGNVQVEVLSGETTKESAKKPEYVATALNRLENAGLINDELKKPENAETAVRKFQALAISTALETIKKQEQAAKPAEAPKAEEPAPSKPEVKPAPVEAPVSDIEAKKADKKAEDLGKSKADRFKKTPPPKNSNLQRVAKGIFNKRTRLTDAEIALFQEWARKYVPTIPIEILTKLITTYDNKKAWGVYEDGVAKFYKRALRGTPYHEVFEAIWNDFLTDNERKDILDELRASNKTFIDRASGKKLEYHTATEEQIKERIADDFGDFQVGKLPARSLGEKIRNFFRRIIEFFKQFISKPTKKDELFKAINAGKFKEYKINQPINRIKQNDGLKTFDFGSLEGQKQTEAKNKAIHNNIINNPNKSMADEGETFNEAYNRVHKTISDIVSHAPANTVVVTHNSVFGLIKLWDDQGRPLELSKSQRVAYTEQDGAFTTGDHFEIQGKNGTIYVVRHGETTDNLEGNFRRADAQLTEKGIEQAKKVGEILKDVIINSIVTSPLERAMHTSGYIMSKQERPAPQYSRIEGLTESEVQDFVEDMTARIFINTFGTNADIFNPAKITGKEMFNRIKEEYSERLEDEETGEEGESRIDIIGGEEVFNQLVKRTRDFLRTFKIEVGEGDEIISINDENHDSREYAANPFKIDWKANSPFAIKFLLGTFLEREGLIQSGNGKLVMPKVKLSSINGYKLLTFSRVFSTVMDKFSNTNSMKDLIAKLLDLARYDSNYVALFTRLKGNLNDENPTINFEDYNLNDWRLFINFYQSFTKQKPNAVIQYKDMNQVFTESASQFDVIRKKTDEWVVNMRLLAKNKDSYIYYDVNTKEYKVSDELKKLPIKTADDKIKFLSEIGIDFPIEAYTALKEGLVKGEKDEKGQFNEAVNKIYSFIGGKQDAIMSWSGATIGVTAHFKTLARLLTNSTNPNRDVTHRNVDGETTQTYSDSNYPSVFEDTFNSSDTLEELLQKRPELKDISSLHSTVLKKGGIFFDEKGERIRNIKVGYIGGTKEIDENSGTSTVKLNTADRISQEINQNLEGKYYVVIPGDGSTEWFIEMGNPISFEDVRKEKTWNKTFEIFNGYLRDDIALAMDDRSYLMYTKPRSKELRFFKDILSPDLLTKVNQLIADNATKDKIDDFFRNNTDAINASIKSYFEENIDETIKLMDDKYIANEYIVEDEKRISYPMLDSRFADKYGIRKFAMTEEELRNIITFVNINGQINNIEFHKILFGDPYQFKIKDDILDEVKRVKSALSPRRKTFDTPEYNNALNSKLNSAGDIKLSTEDVGYHEFKSYVNTITLKDVNIVGSLHEINPAFADTNEADAFSIILDNTYREVKLKNAQWSDEAEKWHQYQLAYTRIKLSEKYKDRYAYKNPALELQDRMIIYEKDGKTLRKQPKYVIEVIKPIVTGNKYEKSSFDFVIDKMSQMPIYYSAIEGTNLENLYLKMMDEKVGYAVMESGRKVGIETLHSVYDGNGTFNQTPFGADNLIKVPWSAYGIQVENSYSGPKEQTMGSQITKVSSMDLFDNGEASEEAKAAYQKNMKWLNLLIEDGYKRLLKKIGVTDLGDRFEVKDKVAVSKALESELLRRNASNNLIAITRLNEHGEFPIPFEASTHYIQIRDILFSMVNKSIISQKVSGGSHVQTPVTLWEKQGAGRTLVRFVDNKWETISREQYAKLTPKEQETVRFTDNTLKFYRDKTGYRHCEVMLPNWFREKIAKGKFKNDDKALLEYLNTVDGGKLLMGIGFRIPTQAMSSIDVIKVKGFLPDYMGSTVVVPSEITTKAGSDFDIDKLNIYLKNVYVDANGNIRMMRHLGSEQETKDFYKKIYEDTIQKEIDRIEDFDEFRDKLLDIVSKIELSEDVAPSIESVLSGEDLEWYYTYVNLLEKIEDQAEQKDINASDYIKEQIQKLGEKKEKLTAKLLNETLKKDYIDNAYTRSLQNEYFDSLEEMLTLPENFNRLVSPVNDGGLKAVAKKLEGLKQENKYVKNRILNRNYLTLLRQSIASAKGWVGIVAVNITGHSSFQKSQIYIDDSTFINLPKQDQDILGDGKIVLPHNKVSINGKQYSSMSGKKTEDGKFYISDRLSGYGTSVVDVNKDPYIVHIMKHDNAVGIFMFLERMGIGELVPIFMNQPIITEYLDFLDSKGVKTLFNEKNIEAITNRFATTEDNLKDAKIDVSMTSMEKNIKDYYEGGKKPFQDGRRNAEQIAILNEFLKYAKMAEYSFKMTQASNYDTTRYRSGDKFHRKTLRTDRARDYNIFSSVDKVLGNTHLGNLSQVLNKSIQAVAEFLILEKKEFKLITNRILDRFGLNDYLSEDKYDRIGVKIMSSFLDFIIQTKSPNLSDEIFSLVADETTSVANRLTEAAREYPQFKALQDLIAVSEYRGKNSTSSVAYKVPSNEAIDENLRIYGMLELKDFPPTTQLYWDIIKISILQGTYRSAITIKNSIPVEDYSQSISQIFSTLKATEDLEWFVDNKLFEKNNWNDPNVTKRYNPISDNFPYYDRETTFERGEDINRYKVDLLFPGVESLGIPKGNMSVLRINAKYNREAVKNDILIVPKIVSVGKTGERINIETGRTVTSDVFLRAKEIGDYSLKDVYGYQKVTYPNGEPLIVFKEDNGEMVEQYIYKQVNLYGDGRFASEYYMDNRPSVLNNGTIKVENEISNDAIISAYSPKAADALAKMIDKGILPAPNVTQIIQMVPDDIAQLERGTKTTSLRSTIEAQRIGIPIGETQLRRIGAHTYNVTNRGYLTVEEAGGKENMLKSEGASTVEDLKFTQSKEFMLGKRKMYVFDIKPASAIPIQETDNLPKEVPAPIPPQPVQVQQPVDTPTAPAKYADKAQRIRIEYPRIINTEYLKGFPSDKLVEFSDISYDSYIDDYVNKDKVDLKKYGSAVNRLFEAVDIEYPEALEWLDKNNELGVELVDSYINYADETGEGLSLQDYVDKILTDNQIFVDTAQLSLFNETPPENLEGADEVPPCGQ